MNREIYIYAYGFIAGVLLAAFVAVVAYTLCDYNCGKRLDELLAKGTVIIVPEVAIETAP